jgi:hypothetical protein
VPAISSSQQVLDRILAEKANVGTHAPADTKPPIFNEAPTKVAPSPLACHWTWPPQPRPIATDGIG